MTSFGRTQLDLALRALGELLAARGLHYEVVLIGGGNLILRELVTRPTTKDLDLLGAWTANGVEPMRPMPEPLRTAVLDVARAYGLATDWVNLGAEALLDLGLPAGFLGRLERHDYGGLVTWLAGRFDMICFSSTPQSTRALGAATCRIWANSVRIGTSSSALLAGA